MGAILDYLPILNVKTCLETEWYQCATPLIVLRGLIRWMLRGCERFPRFCLPASDDFASSHFRKN